MSIISEVELRRVIKNILLEFEMGGISGINVSDTSTDSGGNISENVIERCNQLGEELGIDPAFIYATESKESNHNPKAMAWNLHIALGSKWATKAGVDKIDSVKAKEMRAATLKFTHTKVGSNGASFYGKSAKKAFEAAYKISPWHAIAGGAWGLYQVLGAYTLPKYGNDPTAWKASFDSNPVNYSAESFRTWVGLPEKNGFKEAINKGDYHTTTKMYYGKDDNAYRSYIASKVLKWKNKLSKGEEASSGDKKKLNKESWKGRLGKRIKGGINFHRILDNNNNYRAGIKNKHTNPTVKFWKELSQEYGIKNVISLNADEGGRAAANNAEKAGLTVFKNFIGENSMGNRSAFDKAKNMLKSGNTLIHCTHGADRTGAYVGRYYMEDFGWNIEKAKKDTKKYGGHKPGPDYKSARDFLINGPAS